MNSVKLSGGGRVLVSQEEREPNRRLRRRLNSDKDRMRSASALKQYGLYRLTLPLQFLVTSSLPWSLYAMCTTVIAPLVGCHTNILFLSSSKFHEWRQKIWIRLQLFWSRVTRLEE